MIKFSIGCDPEFFLTKDGSYKAAVGLIGGDKWHPKPIDEVGHAILEDNVAVEFNIQPATSYDAFRSSIHKVLDHLRGILPGYDFSKSSAVSFPDAELDSPQAQEFGCEPDFDAWLKKVNPKPNAKDKNLRSCGGHIHVGSDIAKAEPIELIRAMDVFLGVPSVPLDVDGEARRSLYGAPGCFRIKPYGVEYRTLSNFWIWDDKLIEWAFNGTQRALEFISSGQRVPEEHKDLIQRCILQSNMDDFKQLQAAYDL